MNPTPETVVPAAATAPPTAGKLPPGAEPPARFAAATLGGFSQLRARVSRDHRSAHHAAPRGGLRSEAPAITRARQFIAEKHAEELSLTGVAQAVNMRAFYFCKSFQKATGMTFTDYLARIRVEKAKNLLLNPHKRVSDDAHEAGFQSLSQFNRVFRRVAGGSPTIYREHLHGGTRAMAIAHLSEQKRGSSLAATPRLIRRFSPRTTARFQRVCHLLSDQ